MIAQKPFLRKSVKYFVILAIAVSAIASLSFANRNFEIVKNLDIFATLFKELSIHYVEDINVSEIMKTGIDEMLKSLDPYTNFIPESEIEDYRFMTTGQYGGIGALIMTRGEYIFISETYEGFPADKAGLLPGDKILEINQQSAKNKNQEEISSLLKGQPGTEIEMIISRMGHEQPLVKTLVREVVKIDNIPYYGVIGEKTGYIKLSGFTQNAGKEVKEAFLNLKNNNNIESIVLDLRGNGGGLLNEAVNITNIFVPQNTLIVETKGKLKERNTSHRTLNPPLDEKIPLVVLIDESSASASEIVAGAIQDLDRGLVIGQNSFGKGLVQNVVPLSYNTQLKVTVAKYYIPSGRCIQAIDYTSDARSIEDLPDSLKIPFKTSMGRIVYDGAGIHPDVKVDPMSFSNISIALITKFIIFEYANEFYRKNQEILPPDQFEITDEIFEDFKQFLNSKDYTYQTETEAYLSQLRNAAEKEMYLDALNEDLLRVEKMIEKSKEEDLNTYRKEIEFILKNELIGRYYKQKGRIISALQDDKEIKIALEYFDNIDKYFAILSPEKENNKN